MARYLETQHVLFIGNPYADEKGKTVTIEDSITG